MRSSSLTTEESVSSADMTTYSAISVSMWLGYVNANSNRPAVGSVRSVLATGAGYMSSGRRRCLTVQCPYLMM